MLAFLIYNVKGMIFGGPNKGRLENKENSEVGQRRIELKIFLEDFTSTRAKLQITIKNAVHCF